MLNILVICTGNSCRSIIGEAIFNHLGQGRIMAFSAGSKPKGKINAEALDLLKRHGVNTEGLTSKSWHDLSKQVFDIVITVCDKATKETCPMYLIPALKIHWETIEPSHVEGGDKERLTAFEHTYKTFEQRITKMLALPLDRMDSNELISELATID